MPRFLLFPQPGYDDVMTPKPAPTAELSNRARDEYLLAVDEGLADAKTGRTVPYEKVRRWVLSWGSDKERTRPKCP